MTETAKSNISTIFQDLTYSGLTVDYLLDDLRMPQHKVLPIHLDCDYTHLVCWHL